MHKWYHEGKSAIWAHHKQKVRTYANRDNLQTGRRVNRKSLWSLTNKKLNKRRSIWWCHRYLYASWVAAYLCPIGVAGKLLFWVCFSFIVFFFLFYSFIFFKLLFISFLFIIYLNITF